MLHDQHGQALAERFLGDADEALRQYTQLIRQIREAIEAFEQDGDNFVNVGNFRLGRERLYGRLVNSMERLGDCLLFRDDADFSEAGRWYSKASGLRHLMPVEDADLTRIRLGLKVALCRSQSGEPGERARAQLTFERIQERLAERQWIDDDVRIVRQVARR